MGLWAAEVETGVLFHALEVTAPEAPCVRVRIRTRPTARTRL